MIERMDSGTAGDLRGEFVVLSGNTLMSLVDGRNKSLYPWIAEKI